MSRTAVLAPSLHLLSGGDADNLKLYVQNGGTLVATCNTGLVDEHNLAPDSGYPHDLTDLFGLEVLEFDQLPPGVYTSTTINRSAGKSGRMTSTIWRDAFPPPRNDT